MKQYPATSPYNLQPEILQNFQLPTTITIYDSTLRDGEQMPHVSFTPPQKQHIAQYLDDIGIPEIEAGFPAISKQEQTTIKTIVANKNHAHILVLSRLRHQDIDAARQTDADLILLFIATSPLHLKYKLHLTQDEIKQQLISCLDYANAHGITPSFSSEDSTRTPLPFLEELIQLAEQLGVQRIGLTDTVGCATPQTIQYLFNHIHQKTSLPLSAHLHNDFGLALINALTALSAGATHICATINGWGERAGNVPLEQLIFALQILYNKNLNIDTTKLKHLSELVASYANHSIPLQAPFVGDNIFSHESGIHVAAILENPQTYEPIPPELVGNTRNIVLGKHTGRHLIAHLLQTQNISPDTALVDRLTHEIKAMGERNQNLTIDDFTHLIKKMQLTEP
ncbi:MAG: homoaconitate hydratase [Candidatus Thermoplasmatota archaeon]|nr:homoaconitate hydratase [Candidatus Thermoplasmatota archaeon]MBU1941941.1 homoaconitate hydratase [Candidatus Thermoplasmatota archaeon]